MQVLRLFRTMIAFLAVLLLVGCASRGSLAPLIDNVHPDLSQAVTERIFIATSRKFDPEDPSVYLSPKRSSKLQFASLNVSIPENHREGKIEWAVGRADPRINFAVVGKRQRIYNDNRFIAALNRQLATKSPGDRAIFIFIHGFNNTFAESLFRLAQLKKDAGIGAVTVGFSWPSAAKTSQYLYDRESAAFSRDKLEHLFKLVSRTKTRRIYILAHSLGSWLTMETLRQMKIAGNRRFFSKLSALALAAPDIDEDVFKSQMERLGRLNRPFFVLTSQKDRALGFLSFLTGDIQRVGRIRDYQQLERKYGIHFPNLTNATGGDRLGHSAFATSPVFLKLFRRWVARASGRR